MPGTVSAGDAGDVFPLLPFYHSVSPGCFRQILPLSDCTFLEEKGFSLLFFSPLSTALAL